MANKELLEKLAAEIVELHEIGGIELEAWNTAHEFIKGYYETEELSKITILSKKKMNEAEYSCTNCGNDAGAYQLCLECLNLIKCKCKGK
jgi:hypothetical protein